jgi:Rps23 Pro-64 3,4-dihydroxylase Tpa1-like proline 4-hydroxylase
MKTILQNRSEGYFKGALGKQISLPENIENLKKSYSTAHPFPHLLIDGIFESAVLKELIREIPTQNDTTWLRHDDDHQNLSVLRSAIALGKAGFRLVSILHSASFLYFLSAMTGIPELLPDPYLQGGGYHVMPPGAFFDVHVDRNTAYETGLRRRLSLIIYLNENWRHDYGGQLELWDSAGKKCEAVVEPMFNRTIVFEIGDANYHGVPNPVACPEANARNAFIVYYHTAEGRTVAPHSSVFVPATYRTRNVTHRILRDFIPPIVLRNAKAIRERLSGRR